VRLWWWWLWGGGGGSALSATEHFGHTAALVITLLLCCDRRARGWPHAPCGLHRRPAGSKLLAGQASAALACDGCSKGRNGRLEQRGPCKRNCVGNEQPSARRGVRWNAVSDPPSLASLHTFTTCPPPAPFCVCSFLRLFMV
jgi:hypothetical protein